MKVLYVAGAFTAHTAWDIEQNVRAAERVGLYVARLGVMPLIPHANTRFFHGECTAEFFYAGTLELLKRCDGIILCEGWSDSKGARAAFEYAKQHGMAVFMHGVTPDQSIADWGSMPAAPADLLTRILHDTIADLRIGLGNAEELYQRALDTVVELRADLANANAALKDAGGYGYGDAVPVERRNGRPHVHRADRIGPFIDNCECGATRHWDFDVDNQFCAGPWVEPSPVSEAKAVAAVDESEPPEGWEIMKWDGRGAFRRMGDWRWTYSGCDDKPGTVAACWAACRAQQPATAAAPDPWEGSTKLHKDGSTCDKPSPWACGRAHVQKVGPFADYVEPAPSPTLEATEKPWILTMACCGKDDGTQRFTTWAEAHAVRESYCNPAGTSHERSAVLSLDAPDLAVDASGALRRLTESEAAEAMRGVKIGDDPPTAVLAEVVLASAQAAAVPTVYVSPSGQRVLRCDHRFRHRNWPLGTWVTCNGLRDHADVHASAYNGKLITWRGNTHAPESLFVETGATDVE